MENEDRNNDPAFRAVDEAGGGEAEGFEQSEDLLRENAENAEHGSALDGFPSERESDLSGAEYGDADEVHEASGDTDSGDTDS